MTASMQLGKRMTKQTSKTISIKTNVNMLKLLTLHLLLDLCFLQTFAPCNLNQKSSHLHSKQV